MTNKEKLEFETKATGAMLYRMNKLDKKRNFQQKLVITFFFVTLIGSFITCVVWQTWQMVLFCGLLFVCLFGIFAEQIYDKRRKEILDAFKGPDNINFRFF